MGGGLDLAPRTKGDAGFVTLVFVRKDPSWVPAPPGRQTPPASLVRSREKRYRVGMGARKPSFRIWDNQQCVFVGNSASLHCFSNWTVDAFTGEIVDFVGVVDGSSREQVYTASPNPGCYASGKRIVKKPRYELVQFTGLRDASRRKIYEGDILERSAPAGAFTYVCEWSVPEAAYMLRDQWGKMEVFLPDFLPALRVVGNIRENPDRVPRHRVSGKGKK